MRRSPTPRRLTVTLLAAALIAPTALTTTAAAAATSTDDLVISEYVEGGGYNKAIEVANTTGAAVDLSLYRLVAYHNGSSTPTYTVPLDGVAMLAAGEVYVVANPGASGAVLAVADDTDGGINFNGDDAVVLVDTSTDPATVVDAFGQVGFDPGSQWSSNGVTTQDATLRRTDTTRDTDPGDAFDPSARFAAFPKDTFDDLGSFGAAPPPPPEPSDPCDPDDVTPIHAVQGDGDATPLAGTEVTIEGVVVADFQAYGQLGGFYVQEQDDQTDADPATSEGLFVYGYRDAVSVGDRVGVTGTAIEYRGLTELTGTDTIVCERGVALPTAASLALPASDAERESVEGMAVTLTELTVTETYNVARYGELLLAADGRLWQPTELFAPGSAEAAALAAANEARAIVLDDASTWQNPDPVPYVTDQVVRVGDTIPALHGVLSQAFGSYRIQPTAEVSFTTTNPRPAAPETVGGTVRVASFNVLNYFNGPEFPTPRGADTAEEFARQRTKIVAAITGLDADIVGLMEIENDGYGAESAIADLVAGLNEVEGDDVWRFVDPGTATLGDDAIAVGLLYREGSVSHVGNAAVLDGSVDPRFDDTKNRPVLAATFNHRGEKFTVAVNHLKSKGSSCGAGDDDPEQGSCNLTRTLAAQAEADWLRSSPTGFDEADVLVIGDLNAYRQEDPLTAFADAGFTSQVGTGSHTYVFKGRAGSLDHALASPSLAAKVTGAAVWNINADEPLAYDYDLDYGRPAYLWQPNVYRSSDHDPVVIGLDLNPAGKAKHRA